MQNNEEFTANIGVVKISAETKMSNSNPVEFLHIDDPQWANYLQKKGSATIFHHPVWSRLLARVYKYRPFVAVLKNADGVISAGIPFMEVNSPITGRKWVSLPFSDYCYPVFDNGVELNELIKGVVLFSRSNGISLVEIRDDIQESPILYGNSSHVIHKAVLESDFEKVSGRIHEMHRRNINVARKNNVHIVFGNTHQHMLEFYTLHMRTRRSQGVPVQPIGFFKNIKTMILDQGLGFLLLAYKNDQCIGGAVFLHWHKTLTYKFGASDPAGLNFRPNNLIMWTAMKWGCEHGFLCFDFGRTDMDNTGLRTFKSRWGAEEKPIYYFSTKPPKGKKVSPGTLEKIVHTVIKNSPLWICRLSGELFYRYFG